MANRIIVQPRILTRTEIVRRVVFELGEARDLPQDTPELDDVLSDYQRENVRFWTAVLEDYSFSDVTVRGSGCHQGIGALRQGQEFGLRRLGVVLRRIPLPQFPFHRMLPGMPKEHTAGSAHL